MPVATHEEQDWSLEQTSKLNDAYRTLRDPILRTEYLLRLEGVKSGQQSKQATELARATGSKRQTVPPELLEEVFELNCNWKRSGSTGRSREAMNGRNWKPPGKRFKSECRPLPASFRTAGGSGMRASPGTGRRHAAAEERLVLLNRAERC